MLNIIKSRIFSSGIEGDKGKVFFLNPYTYLLLRKRKELLSKADRIYIDGQWLCNFLKWFGVTSAPRVSFDNSSWAPVVFKHACETNKKVALVGSDEKASQQFKKYVEREYPDINIVYSRNGYFCSSKETKESQEEIIDSSADIVVIGMGAIKQEEFLVELCDKGWNGTGYTCGGFMHQTASKGHVYYPGWVDKLNLRFAYRIWDEPKLLRRYTLDYMHFVVCFFIDWFYLKDSKKK